MAKGYWIAGVDVHNDDGYKPYARPTRRSSRHSAGASWSAAATRKSGRASRSRNVVIEFPDYAAALACSLARYRPTSRCGSRTRLPTSSSSKATTARGRNFFAAF